MPGAPSTSAIRLVKGAKSKRLRGICYNDSSCFARHIWRSTAPGDVKREPRATPDKHRAERDAEHSKVAGRTLAAPPRDRHSSCLPVPHDEPRGRNARCSPPRKSSFDDDPDVGFTCSCDLHGRLAERIENPNRCDVHSLNVLAHGHYHYEPMAGR